MLLQKKNSSKSSTRWRQKKDEIQSWKAWITKQNFQTKIDVCTHTHNKERICLRKVSKVLFRSPCYCVLVFVQNIQNIVEFKWNCLWVKCQWTDGDGFYVGWSVNDTQ